MPSKTFPRLKPIDQPLPSTTPLYFHQRREGSFALPGYDEARTIPACTPTLLPNLLRLYLTQLGEAQRPAILLHQLVFL